MKNIKRRAAGAGAVVALAAALLLVPAGAANAANSYVYQGSCGAGCFKYSNGSQNAYMDRWMGMTFHLTNQVPY